MNRCVVLAMTVATVTMLGVNYINSSAMETLLSVEDLRKPLIIAEEIVTEEEVIETTEIVEPEKEYRYIQDCPMREELQEHIFDICEENGISFEFVMSVIAQESSFNAHAIGDNCQSKGLMQIQERWHSEVMESLGVSDLYNPLDNVRVGVAILCNYFEESDDVYYVLMKYNGGPDYVKRMMESGNVSEYALEITERAVMYERENGI